MKLNAHEDKELKEAILKEATGNAESLERQLTWIVENEKGTKTYEPGIGPDYEGDWKQQMSSAVKNQIDLRGIRLEEIRFYVRQAVSLLVESGQVEAVTDEILALASSR